MSELTSTEPHTDATGHDVRGRAASTPAAAVEPMTTAIQAVLLRHLQENYLPQGGDLRIDPGDDLFDSGILDSAAVLSVILFIEQEFGVTIPDEDLLPENIASVDAAVAYITRRLDGRRIGVTNREKLHGVSEEVSRLGPR
jgi:acyl carrier protein